MLGRHLNRIWKREEGVWKSAVYIGPHNLWSPPGYHTLATTSYPGVVVGGSRAAEHVLG